LRPLLGATADPAPVIHAHQEGDKKVYPGAPHGLMATHKDQLDNDLLAFVQS
jgi:non-heme chloroperoxidase